MKQKNNFHSRLCTYSISPSPPSTLLLILNSPNNILSPCAWDYWESVKGENYLLQTRNQERKSKNKREKKETEKEAYPLHGTSKKEKRSVTSHQWHQCFTRAVIWQVRSQEFTFAGLRKCLYHSSWLMATSFWNGMR